MKKRILLAGKWLFFVASIVYLADFARKTASSWDIEEWLDARTIWATLAAAVAYALAACLAAFGWRRILADLGRPIPAAAGIAIFCATQAAKYLPGNVGHHIGRVALARSRLGVPAGTTMVSILQESAFACLAAVLVAAVCFLLVPGDASPIQRLPVVENAGWLLAPVLGAVCFAFINANRDRLALSARRPVAWIANATPTWRALLHTSPYFAGVYAINGIAFWLVALATVGAEPKDFLLLTGVYALSWIVGFLLPGAPGGLGVREAALVMMLNGVYPAEATLALSISSRLATVIADALLFAFGQISYPRDPRR